MHPLDVQEVNHLRELSFDLCTFTDALQEGLSLYVPEEEVASMVGWKLSAVSLRVAHVARERVSGDLSEKDVDLLERTEASSEVSDLIGSVGEQAIVIRVILVFALVVLLALVGCCFLDGWCELDLLLFALRWVAYLKHGDWSLVC